MVGKYTDLSDAYLSVTKALQHACMAANRKLKVRAGGRRCSSSYGCGGRRLGCREGAERLEGPGGLHGSPAAPSWAAFTAFHLAATRVRRWSGWRRPTWRTRRRRRSPRRTRVGGWPGADACGWPAANAWLDLLGGMDCLWWRGAAYALACICTHSAACSLPPAAAWAKLRGADGILVPGGFGGRGIEGARLACWLSLLAAQFHAPIRSGACRAVTCAVCR